MVPPGVPPELPPPLPVDATEAPRRPIRPWRWVVHLLLIGGYPVLIGLLGLAAGHGAPPALASSPPGLILATVIELVFFSMVFGGAWLASRASPDALLLRWRNGFWPVPWGVGYSLLLRFAIVIVAMAVAGFILLTRLMTLEQLQAFANGNNPDIGSLIDIDALRRNPVYFWLMVTYVSFIFAGLREELWRAAFLAGVRALWPERFRTRRAQIAAVALAAVVFGIGHAPQGAVGATAAGLLGFGLGIIMVVHRSIWPAVIAHGCFDATTFALIPWIAEKIPGLH